MTTDPLKDYTYLPLFNGGFAKIDTVDLIRLAPFSWRRIRKGKVEYAIRWSGRKPLRVLMHREILGAQVGDRETDHINGDGLDNRRSNLRPATTAQNQMNRSHYGKNRFKGVSKVKRNRSKPWQVRVVVDGKHTHIGMFATEEEAARAYNAAARKHYGEFARCNEVTHGQ